MGPKIVCERAAWDEPDIRRRKSKRQFDMPKMEYEFELRFKLPTDDADADELVERLGEAGCDDALIGIGQPGRIALRFTREAESAKRAIVSALEDVKKVIPAAKLIEVGPDFVGLTDV